MLGNRNLAMLKPHLHCADTAKLLNDELAQPSLYDDVLRLLARQNLAVPETILSRDVRKSHTFNEDVEALWKIVYQSPEQYWSLYELAEKLVDLEDYTRRWRFNHVTTVERVIGFKRGTGGTGGVSYLKRMLEVSLFPELWSVRTSL